MMKNKKDFGLKKNLFRVKQLADQGLGRAEKTEVLSEDLQNAEKKVELLKTVLQNMVKKLAVLLHAYTVHDQDKKLKKMPTVQLAQSLDENSLTMGEGMLSDVFDHCAKGLRQMGEAQVTYEMIVEKEALEYFQQLLDVDIPAIKKSKNQLKQLTLDMDATRSRQQSANKESSHHPSSSNQTRTDTLTNDLEDAEKRVAECKDRYATEMLTFMSKEAEICQRIVEWMDAQAQYYRSCLTHVDDMLPDIKCMIEQHSTRPVYGCPLDEHLQSSGREIALVIEACVGILYHDGLEEEGLFRIAGSAAKLKKLKAAFNVGTLVDMEEYYSDFHVVAGALKQYVRELPEPLLTFDLFDEFLSCLSMKDRDAKLRSLWTTVKKLPETNFNNVKYLIKFLSKLAEKSAINKMTPSNIAIVFGPNLLYSRNSDMETNVVLSMVQNQVVEILVHEHEYFFPGDVKFTDMKTVEASASEPQRAAAAHGRRPSATPVSPPAIVEPAASLHNNASFKQKPVTQQQQQIDVGATSPSMNHNMSSSTQLSASSLSVASSDGSSCASPTTLRRSKKPAPPPPPSTSPHHKQPQQSPPNRPEQPKLEQAAKPEQTISRSESIRKPTIPPPGPPKSARPNNPPPPKPAGPVTPKASPGPDMVSGNPFETSEPAYSSNPFETASEVNISDQDSVSFSNKTKSESSSPEGVKKTHTRNASADLTQSHTLLHDGKGHSRAKSHDFRMRQPPPIPQRTHSIPANHSMRNKTAQLVDTGPVSGDSGVVSLGESVTASSSSSVSGNPFDDVIIENVSEADDESETRDRMNSQTGNTSL